MGASIPIGRVTGIRMRFHWTIFLLACWPVGAIAMIVDRSTGEVTVEVGLAWIVALFASVAAHEIAHSIVVRLRIGRGRGRGHRRSLAIEVILVAASPLAGAHVWPSAQFVGS
jgi:Zn-dependent protease